MSIPSVSGKAYGGIKEYHPFYTKGDRIIRYDKSKLNDYYLEGRNKDAILNVLPDELRKMMNG